MYISGAAISQAAGGGESETTFIKVSRRTNSRCMADDAPLFYNFIYTTAATDFYWGDNHLPNVWLFTTYSVLVKIDRFFTSRLQIHEMTKLCGNCLLQLTFSEEQSV